MLDGENEFFCLTCWNAETVSPGYLALCRELSEMERSLSSSNVFVTQPCSSFDKCSSSAPRSLNLTCTGLLQRRHVALNSMYGALYHGLPFCFVFGLRLRRENRYVLCPQAFIQEDFCAVIIFALKVSGVVWRDCEARCGFGDVKHLTVADSSDLSIEFRNTTLQS